MKTEPTEALRLLSETKLNPIHEIPRYKAELAAKIAFQEGQSSPKIKQLEWVEVSSYYLATNEFGFYKIMHNLGSWYLYFNARFILDYANPDEAKVVAQADFEKKVRECLE